MFNRLFPACSQVGNGHNHSNDMFIKEYRDKIKGKRPDCVLILRSDNRYFLLEEDAQLGNELSGLPLKTVGEDKLLVTSFPLSELDDLLQKFVRANRRAVILEVPFYASVRCADDGMLTLHNARTLKRYHELNAMHPKEDDYAVFYAFNGKQYAEGIERLIAGGYIRRGEENAVIGFGGGGYGTEDGIDGFLGFYKQKIKMIADECDPYEVYCYEYNNHESFLSWDGDMGAIQIVIDYWGADTARTIKRFSPQYSIEQLAN